MYKSRGLRLPVYYFFENHLFDLLNNTDTHNWLPKIYYSKKPKNFSDGILYMSSWTSVIKDSTNKALMILKEKGNFQLIDIGCGKGKVLCIWELMFKKSKVRIVGVEYSEELIRISKKNLETLNSKNTSLFKVDALDLDLGSMEDNLLIYIYNPFNENILYKFLKKIEPKTVAIVYINPIHTKCFKKHNFNLNYEKKGWHPNASYNIYTNF
tara:strand:- start:1948 stop:2580 length:633 start_codon:yes stop_codon:yes gene_type:complete